MIYFEVFGFVFLVGWLGYLTYTLNSFIKEKKKVLENIGDVGVDKIIETQNKKLSKVVIDTAELYQIFEAQNKQLKQSITKCGVVRFNPFAGEGGNQSFAIALLNDYNDGVIISSLYSRSGGSRIYAKALDKGKSEISLTKEEETAIKKAI